MIELDRVPSLKKSDPLSLKLHIAFQCKYVQPSYVLVFRIYFFQKERDMNFRHQN